MICERLFIEIMPYTLWELVRESVDGCCPLQGLKSLQVNVGNWEEKLRYEVGKSQGQIGRRLQGAHENTLELCVSLTASDHSNMGDLQKQVPFSLEFHACLVQDSEKRKRKVPQALQELQAQLCSSPTRCARVKATGASHRGAYSPSPPSQYNGGCFTFIS